MRTPWVALGFVLGLATTRLRTLQRTGDPEPEREARRWSAGDPSTASGPVSELDQLRDEFLASVSHELRTPLTAIVAYLEILLDEEPGPLNDEQREFLQVMDRSSDRLRRQVDDLLLLARIDAGKFTLEPSVVDLHQLAGEVLERATLQAERNRVDLGLEGIAVMVRGDRGRLLQMIDNLVSNAIRFTPPGGRVVCGIGEEIGNAIVTVSDTGVGIDSTEQGRIFERFYRASNAHSLTIQGTGIGLTIVRAVAEAHGGVVAVRSRSGGGSSFRVEIPIDIFIHGQSSSHDSEVHR